jgi:uncharacterized damage-inducible protein DinB
MNALSLKFLWQYMVYADQQILTATNTVGDEAYGKPLPMSMGSLHKQVVHAILAQETWLQRLNGQDAPYPTGVEFPRVEVAERWNAVHERLTAFANEQTDESLKKEIRATTRIGKIMTPVWVVMAHVADHATYHRGHINTMVKQLGGTPSPVMLYTYAVAQGFGKAL